MTAFGDSRSATAMSIDRRKLLLSTLAVIGALACVGLPASLTFQKAAEPQPLSWSVIAACAAGASMLALAAFALPAKLGIGVATRFLGLGSNRWLPPLLVGLLLRLVVDLALAARPGSDGAVYLGLAESMARGGAYLTSSTWAYWPPGLSLALVPLLWLAGSPAVALSVYGLSSFAIAALGTRQLCLTLGLDRYISLPLWLLALWPGMVLCSGLPEKELLAAALMPWMLAFAWRSRHGGLAPAAGAGVLLGGLTLVQPSLQLFPLAALAFVLAFDSPRWVFVKQAAVVVVVMLLTVSPWTYRNYQVLGAPVLVSTNGGSNLYRANNELATGGFVAKGKVDVEALEELEADRTGKRLASEWIRNNPARFVQLAAGKVLLFLGDDSYGAYAVFRVGGVAIAPIPYLMVKALSALPWVACWLTILVLSACRATAASASLAPVGLVVLPILYLLGIHSVFESGGKYHLPVLCPLLVLLLLLARSRSGQAGGESNRVRA